MAETTVLSLCFPSPTPARSVAVDETMTNLFQQLCVNIGQQHSCQAVLDISINSSSQAKKRLSIDTHQSVYNVTITGAYQNVMQARGSFMRKNPLKPKLSIKISKSAITSIASNENGSEQEQQQDSSSPTKGSPNTEEKPTTQEALPPPSTCQAFSSYFTVIPQFKNAIDRISSTTRTTITMLSNQFHSLPSAKSVVAAHARQEMVELLISGSWEDAEAARLQLLVAIDELQHGVVSDKIQIDLKFQNMIGGRKRQELQELMAKTRTSIYLCSPLVQTVGSNGSPVDALHNEIYITGEASKVRHVKETLAKAYTRAQAAATLNTRQVSIASRKLDWMLDSHREKLRAIMSDNATFISFPPLGSAGGVIQVYGESRVNVERTIRTVMQLSSQFHSGSITLLTPMRDNLVLATPSSTGVLSPVANVAKLVSQVSGAEVEFRNSCFYMFGNEIQTRIAVQFLADVDFVKTAHYEVKFSVELANEHREFISGKKNGKINRIMKATGAKIKFEPCNEYNFYVDLSSNVAVKAVEALALLQEELPAEISFYVPETYHKRIIGVGGKNIQRIMKKYGVYVKFSNSEEFANLGGYFDNLDNVVARTPSKNAMNLDNLKHAVMELVSPKDKDFVHHTLSIPKQYHLALMSDHARALSEVQDATNAIIRFPARETGSDTVSISGPESLIQQATSMLLSLVDEQYVYPVPFSEAMGRVLSKPEFRTEVLDRMKNEWNMTLVPPPPREVSSAEEDQVTETSNTKAPTNLASPSNGLTSGSTNGENGAIPVAGEEKLARSLSSLTDSDDGDDSGENEEDDHVFVFKYSRNNEDYLQNAKELLVQFLIDNQIEVYDDEIRIQRPRSDSFAEAFPHFNSKILSSVAAGELNAPTPAFLNYSLFENAGNAFDSPTRGPGAAISQNGYGAGSMVAPDIRSLFPNGGPGLPPLASSPPRWPEQHSRHLASVPNTGSQTAAGSGSAFSKGLASNSGHHFGQTSEFHRVTSLPADTWAIPVAPQSKMGQHHSPSGYPSSLGQFRTPPPGMSGPSSGLGHGTPGTGFFSPSNHGQQPFSPEGPYTYGSGFQTPGSTSSSHLYSNSNSPVQGNSSNIGGGYGPLSPVQQQPQHHQPSPQRPISGSSTSSRDSLQGLEDRIPPVSNFGPGYGPSLNSGSVRTLQQQMAYQHQQQGGYASHSNFGHYPQSRQRHSSHNSNASSHHTMFLGPIGGDLASAGDSVHSDEISTEDESDEPFDEMRNRLRAHHTLSLQHPYHRQGGLHGAPNFSVPPTSSVLSGRRGSVPSMGSIYSNQQLYSPQQHFQNGHHQSVTPPPSVIRPSHSNSDLYGRKSLVSAMARHSLGPPENNGNSGSNCGLSLGGALPVLNSRSPFGHERDLFSSGLGGIIGGGTISHTNGTSNGGHGYNVVDNHAKVNRGNGSDEPPRGVSSGVLMNSTLSPSALPFLDPGQHMVGGWNR
ncbi:hypothetical protein BGZ81_007184 [Podila clonocystis]|nr:hypothetical protein BGZ81_007184 [Podila clonocystis]